MSTETWVDRFRDADGALSDDTPVQAAREALVAWVQRRDDFELDGATAATVEGEAEVAADAALAVERARNADLHAEVKQLRALVDKVWALVGTPLPAEHYIPPAGTVVVRTRSGGYQNLPEEDEVFLRLDPGSAVPVEFTTGVFYPLGGRTDKDFYLLSMAEMLALDDPACDRVHVELAEYVPVAGLLAALTEDGAA